MKKLLSVSLVGLLSINILQAQNEIDALRYSQTTIGGTARSLAMGGAFGAVGADFSTLSMNPAGLALYKHSEMSFSPTLFAQHSNTSFLGGSTNNNKYNFYFNNAGLVYSFDNENDKGWSNFNFGFGYNRLQDFNFRANYSGYNTDNSISDFFLEKANTFNSGAGIAPADAQTNVATAFDIGLAINKDNTGLLFNSNPGVNNMLYTSNLAEARAKLGAGNVGVQQDATISRSGGMGEVNVAFGANYANKLYLGGSLNFPTLSYNEQSTFTETDSKTAISEFQSMKYTQNVSTTGTGFNLKVGAIYRITDWVRVGAYAQTPTVLNLSDDYTSSLDVHYDRFVKNSSNTDSITSYSANSPEGNFSYSITTPGRTGGNLAFILLKKAIISGDVEYVNYGGASITSDSDPFSAANAAIQAKYKGAYNFRFGTEYKVDNTFSLRAGYAYYQSPFKSGMVPSSINPNTISYTGGLGIRGEGYFIDFAYIFTQQGLYIQPYSLSAQVVNGATIKNETQNFVVTIGFKF